MIAPLPPAAAAYVAARAACRLADAAGDDALTAARAARAAPGDAFLAKRAARAAAAYVAHAAAFHAQVVTGQPEARA